MKFFRPSIIFQTLGALLLTEILSVVALIFLGKKEPAIALPMPAFTVYQFVIIFLFATAILFLLIKLFRGRAVFELIFSLAIFAGIWLLSSLILPNDFAILLASLLTLARLFIPYVAAQNLIMIFGVAGLAVTIGAPSAWQTILMLLLILSFYDIIAVYHTKHMVTMFRGLLERGVIFALIIPERLRGQFFHLRQVNPAEGFFFLGSGDLALPTAFVVAAFSAHPALGVGAALGSFLGLGLTDLVFSWSQRRSIPALPPIALGTMVGFFVAMAAQEFLL